MRISEIIEAARIGTGITKAEIPERYRKYPLIARGTTSAILEKDADTVIMLTKDEIKKDWLFHELGIAKYIESFDSRHDKLGDMPIYVLEMPRLYPLSREQKKIANDLAKLLASKMSKHRTMTNRHWKKDLINDFYEYFDQWNENNAEPHMLEQLVNFLANYSVDQYEWDLRQGNFMQSKDGELVILDPIVDKEIRDAFRGKLQ
jgi:Lhr-like helicase